MTMWSPSTASWSQVIGTPAELNNFNLMDELGTQDWSCLDLYTKPLPDLRVFAETDLVLKLTEELIQENLVTLAHWSIHPLIERGKNGFESLRVCVDSAD